MLMAVITGSCFRLSTSGNLYMASFLLHPGGLVQKSRIGEKQHIYRKYRVRAFCQSPA